MFTQENPKLFICQFIKNKQVPTNAEFSLTKPDGTEVTIDLDTTVKRIYENAQGNDVKKILKRGNFRNATIEQCLKLFEGAAQRFLLDDMNSDQSRLVQDILEKVHRRKDSLFVELKVSEETVKTFEFIFKNKDELEQPYSLKEWETKEIVRHFSKRELIEYLLEQHENVLKVI